MALPEASGPMLRKKVARIPSCLNRERSRGTPRFIP